MKKIKQLFDRLFCLHDYVPASPLKYGSFAIFYVCRKCGKKSLYMD